MSITDELREWMLYHPPAQYAVFSAIADHIDERHEQTKRNLTDALQKQEDATRELDEKSMLLPRDADGEVIRIGDVVENLREDLEPQLHHKFKVYGINYRAYGQACTLTEDGYPSILYRAHECRHYHEPTVEDVLREFAQAMNENMGNYVGEAIDADEWRDADAETISEYAKKLREVVEHECI